MVIDSVQIECFLAVAKHLSFSKAADFLYISQPVLSRRILKLEQELGFELFVRSSRGLKLTKEGEMFREFFFNTSDEFNKLIEAMNTDLNTTKRQIRICVCEGLDLSKYIREILSGYKEINPNIEVIFDSGPVESILESFKHDYYDLIIMLKVTIESYIKSGIINKIRTFDFINTNECVIYSKHNPLSSKEKLELKDFEKQSLFCLKKEHVPQRVLTHSDLFEKYGVFPQIRFFPNMDSIYMALQIGDGFCVFDNHERILNSEDILHFDLDEKQAISFICHSKKNKIVSDFISYCMKLKF